MKKSLLVVPALGVMLLAAAGSVGGTVAWFSSVSSVSAAANNFQAVALDGSLSLTLNEGTGTTISQDGKSVKLANTTRLTHASVDEVSGKVYTISSEETLGARNVATVSDSNAISGLVARNNYGDNSDQTVYYAVTWKMTFSFEFAGEKDVNLYFDPSSTLEQTAKNLDNVDANQKTYLGFRIAFIEQTDVDNADTTNAETRVWAPYSGHTDNIELKAAEGTEGQDGYKAAINHTSTDVAKRLVDGDANWTAASYVQTGTGYESGTLIDADVMDDDKIPEGTVVNSKTGANYLGTFHNNASPTADRSLVYLCAAWFEGTDKSIATYGNMIMDAITVNMKFYTREYKAA